MHPWRPHPATALRMAFAPDQRPACISSPAKGGTGKTTVAAALALRLATGGRKVLLVEVEGRQGIAQLFDVPPLPYQELRSRPPTAAVT